MATYYVRKSGSDSNAGTSAGAAWLTLGKALGASGIASGDTVYVGAGTYREVVTVAMTSATAETQVIGDVSGQFTGDAGEVVWTARVTDDETAPVSANTLDLAGRDYLTFENFIIFSGTTRCVNATTTNSTNCTFRRCIFRSSAITSLLVAYTGTAGQAANWTFDRCYFISHSGTCASITLPTSASADYNVGISITNCVFMIVGTGGNWSIIVGVTGANSFKGGGISVYNCAFFGFNGISANVATSLPFSVYNSYWYSSGTALSGASSGMIVEDYNVFMATTPRTNVSIGSNSSTTKAATWSEGRECLWGLRPVRPWGMPTESSTMLGFGAQSGGPVTDISGGPRASGGASTSYAVGPYERPNAGTKETSVTHAGAASLKLTGPGYHDFQVPVDASITTITVYARYDTNHAATNKPQISVLGGGEIGVSDATATMTAAVDTWEALQLTFTPTAKGVVTIRCISRSAAGNGIAYFDS
ncbi:MAG: hypothetical protein IPK75_18430 [Acidobacteria bacterium]|nr:hypothetical protein [Acidobacteriota bacterium]